MRRLASGLVLLVVAAVVLAAAVDAIQSALAPEPARADPKPRPIDGLTLLSGRMLWSDHRCRLHTTSMTTLQQLEPTRRVGCRLRLTSSGTLERGAPSRTAFSPSGLMLAEATQRELTIVKDGRRIRFPLAGMRALAWSPDDRWLAATDGQRTYLIRVLDRDLRIRRLPIVATDLAWLS
jgi:hypothetical protein